MNKFTVIGLDDLGKILLTVVDADSGQEALQKAVMANKNKSYYELVAAVRGDSKVADNLVLPGDSVVSGEDYLDMLED